MPEAARSVSGRAQSLAGAGPAVAVALRVLTCGAVLTYLERISCRPGSLAAIRSRGWACSETHAYWIRRLKDGGWLLASPERVQLDPRTVTRVRDHLEGLYGLPAAYPMRWRTPEPLAMNEGSACVAAEPRDLLLALAIPARRSIYEALALQPQRIGRLASRLGYVRSLVSYHVKQLGDSGLIERDGAGVFSVDVRIVGSVMAYLEHLEIGWPYPARRGGQDCSLPSAGVQLKNGKSPTIPPCVTDVAVNTSEVV